MADGYPAGTSNGQDVIAPVGNSFIDGIASLSNVLASSAGSVLTAGGTFIDRLTALKVANAQKVAAPAQSYSPMPNSTASQNMSQYLMYGLYAVGGIGALIVLMKFAK